MAKLSEKDLAMFEKGRDLNAELLQAVQDLKVGEWVRKTEFTTQADGSVHRMITRRDGTIEKDEIISAEKAQVAAARAENTFRSRSNFAESGYTPSRSIARIGSLTRYR